MGSNASIQLQEDDIRRFQEETGCKYYWFTIVENRDGVNKIYHTFKLHTCVLASVFERSNF